MEAEACGGEVSVVCGVGEVAGAYLHTRSHRCQKRVLVRCMHL